ncbi:hypothetical protein [Streptomyces sp. NPDC005507]
MRPLVSRTPGIVSTTIESADGRSRTGAFQVDWPPRAGGPCGSG